MTPPATIAQGNMTPYRIDAVLFDFDGTLTQPGSLDFRQIKQELGCPVEQPVLEFIDALTDDRKRRSAWTALDRFESDGARRSVPHPEAGRVIRHCRWCDVRVGIISRNSLKAITTALANFHDLALPDFDIIISRDDAIAPKPAPDGVIAAADRLGTVPERILVVGDYLFDVESGISAGALTALVPAGHDFDPAAIPCHFHLEHLADLCGIIDMGRPLPAGKLPSSILERLLDDFQFEDPSIIFASGIGEDTAAVEVQDEEVLVLKSDPITFATDAAGEYAVVVNANDIVTSGARPRWFLATLLFPPGITGSHVSVVMKDLRETCERWDITLCGGHTEITDAVGRTLISGMMAGTVSRRRLIDKQHMQPGDIILLTKGVAVEGTAIIAREFAHRLRAGGMDADTIDRCRRFLERISILPEARIAADHPGVSAMHDVTEGGLAAAMLEFGVAGGCILESDISAIPVFPETLEICRILGIDPLGLIGSGSLLIACRPAHTDGLVAALSRSGIDVSVIGSAVSDGKGIRALENGREVEWPEFVVDEITRLY